MENDFDVLVVGSGAGGGTFASACARQGKRVLLLERGQNHVLKSPVHDEREMLIDKKPYDDRTIPVNGEPRRLYMGSGVGGGTALYGAALVRPSADDFHPGKHYGRRLPHGIWDWPISYQDLEPYYSEAESLYGVTGHGEDDFGPLPKPRRASYSSGVPLKPINRTLIAASRARGLRPFRLPLAIDFDRCLQCAACPGYLCVNGSRRSSAQLIDQAIADQFPLHMLTNVEAQGFSRDGSGRIDGVSVRERTTGQLSTYRAQRYALAAGAIGSSALLLRSGLNGPMVGRHYMLHLCPIVIGIFSRRTGADETYVKQLGFADYYFGTKRCRQKLGLIQSLPVPGPLMLAKATGGRLPKSVLEFLRKRMVPLTGIVEDLPNPTNRVALNGHGEVELRHSFAPYDLERGRLLGRLMSQILRHAGALFCLCKSFPSVEHVAHQCGTLRFGNDPAHALLDRDCRMYGQPNLFVVDGSFFPTSLGVGPALTIMANALRVAGIVTKET